MQITVEMIDTKEFKIKPRGYDQQEVDDFLDAIGDEMVRQLDTIQSLQQQLAQAKAARPAVEAPTQVLKPVQPKPVAAAVPTAWPRMAQVPITRVELSAVWVAEMLRPANIRLAMLREYRHR